jgi:hypothetical protein
MRRGKLQPISKRHLRGWKGDSPVEAHRLITALPHLVEPMPQRAG